MSRTVYATKVNMEDEDDVENITQMASEGTPVIVCEDLVDAAELLGIDESEIKIV